MIPRIPPSLPSSSFFPLSTSLSHSLSPILSLWQVCYKNFLASGEHHTEHPEHTFMRRWLPDFGPLVEEEEEEEAERQVGMCQAASQMSQAPAVVGGKDAEDALHAGDRVEVHSLQAKPEYNGKPGTLVAFIDESGRWQVDLASGGSITVKAANLTKVSSRVSPPRASGGAQAGEGAWAKSRVGAARD